MANEREELIAALHQITAFAEGLLALSERLVLAYDTDPRPIARNSTTCAPGSPAGANSCTCSGSGFTALSVKPPRHLQ